MSDLGDSASGAAPPRAFSVAALLLAAADALQLRLGAIAVRGELSGYSRAASGHCYFSLKDTDGANALLRCAMFRRAASLLDFAPRDGQQVEVRGRIGIYEPRGELQCVVEAMLPLGAGSLYELFLRQKAKLEAAGLFDPARKRLPAAHPSAIGVVSSTAGAALHDVLTTLARRAPHVQVIIYPSAVQGAEAPGQLVQALQRAGRRDEVDTLIVCRGGGSIEDLWAFNEEAVARAVFQSRLPIVSGVGHETDFTICDFVADARAPTPTGAAALAAPDGSALRQRVAHLGSRVHRAACSTLERRMQRFDAVARRLIHPAARLAAQRERLAHLRRRLVRSLNVALDDRCREVHRLARRVAQALRAPPPQRARLDSARARWTRSGEARLAGLAQRVAALAVALKHLDPQAVLDRGYSIVSTTAGAVVQDAARVAPGDGIVVRFARGAADATVIGTHRASDR